MANTVTNKLAGLFMLLTIARHTDWFIVAELELKKGIVSALQIYFKLENLLENGRRIK